MKKMPTTSPFPHQERQEKRSYRVVIANGNSLKQKNSKRAFPIFLMRKSDSEIVLVETRAKGKSHSHSFFPQ